MTRLFSCIITVTLMTLSFSASADYEGKSKGKAKHGFYEAATKYKEKAAKYKKKGMHDIAKGYERMSQIKTDAAKKADEGRWDDISWDEYHQIDAQINSKLHGHKKHHHKK